MDDPMDKIIFMAKKLEDTLDQRADLLDTALSEIKNLIKYIESLSGKIDS